MLGGDSALTLRKPSVKVWQRMCGNGYVATAVWRPLRDPGG